MTNGRPTAKMADFARKLPKWQISKSCAKSTKKSSANMAKFFLLIFFLAIADIYCIIRERKGWIEK
jgi:hypothetical protein